MTRPSIKCYVNECLFMRILIHDNVRINHRLWAFKVLWSPSFECCAYLQEVVLKNSPSDHLYMIHLMPCRNPWRLYIHRAFTYSLCWRSLKRSVKYRTWTTGSAFSTNESAWSVMVTGSESHVWSGPKSPWPITLQALSWVEKAESGVQVRFTLRLRDQRSEYVNGRWM